ncbi:MAG: hypothetical protein U0165_01520 [Polyangiaceae bacterium]
MPRPEHLRVVPADDTSTELVDVPAAIVCAHCGSPECPGCAPDPFRATGSGVHFFVPWERPDRSVWGRFWDTTRATTYEADTFFSSLPDGSLATALAFAIIAEVVAVGATLVGWGAIVGGVAFLIAPAFTLSMLGDAAEQIRLLRVALAAWFAFSVALVVAHATHGLALDRMARRAGAEARLNRALRFGLYAAGWDVATSPFGVLVSLFQSGPSALRSAMRFAVLTPTQATAAFVKAAYRRDATSSVSIRRRAMLVTMPLSILVVLIALVRLRLGVSNVSVGRGSARLSSYFCVP